MAIKTTIRKNGKGSTKVVELTALSAIRAFCVECTGWSFDEVNRCTDPLCPLYPFRFGKNPSRKGIGRQGGGDIAKARTAKKNKNTLNSEGIFSTENQRSQVNL